MVSWISCRKDMFADRITVVARWLEVDVNTVDRLMPPQRTRRDARRYTQLIGVAEASQAAQFVRLMEEFITPFRFHGPVRLASWRGHDVDFTAFPTCISQLGFVIVEPLGEDGRFDEGSH